ncbi:hypothetical protein BH11PSE14_BH11PSE14_02710 [soil metagenome]
MNRIAFMPATPARQRGPVLAASIVLLVLAFSSANILLTLGSLALMVLLVRLLWRPGEPPALLFAMGYHWMQASILVFYADVKGRSLDTLGYGPQITAATWLTLAGVLAVALGMRLGAQRNYGEVASGSVSAIATLLSVRRLFVACLTGIALSLLATRFAYVIPGLIQPILALTLLRWVVEFLLAYTVLAQQRGFGLLAIVFVVEVAIGFLGFFSDFKTVLIIMLLAALTSPGSLQGLRLRTAILLGIVVLSLGIVWTGVKAEYRDFLNQGSGQQVVLVPVSERVDKLAQLVGDMTRERLGDSVVALVERVTYVYYFGQAMETVPSNLPYERGLLWREAIGSALVPRLINPAKRVIDDSERTSYYTGNRVSGAEEGTSISLGYVAESYIDFGSVLMMAPLFLWGLFAGWLYRILVRSTRYPLVGYGCGAVLVSLGAATLEQSNLKMVSAYLLGFLVLYLAQKFLAPRVLGLLAAPVRVRPAVGHHAGGHGRDAAGRWTDP